MTANRDIVNLDINKLFGELSKIAEGNRKAKAGNKKVKGKIDIHKKVEPRKPLVLRTLWKNEAVILIVTRLTCACCGTEYLVPNPELLVRRTSKAVGTHCVVIKPEEDYRDLPRLIEHWERAIPSCQLCHTIEEAVFEMGNSPCQLSLLEEK